MFNLDEAWDKAYTTYFTEQTKNADEEFKQLFEDIEEAENEALNGFNIIENYMKLTEDVHGVPPRDNPGYGDHNDHHDDSHNNNDGHRDEDQHSKPGDSLPPGHFGNPISNGNKLDTNVDSGITYLVKLMLGSGDNGHDNAIDKSMTYQPMAAVSKVTRIQDMKFPKNIIFFIQQLIDWIKRVIFHFVEKFKNILRAWTGAKLWDTDKDDLTFKLSAAKKLDTVDAVPLYGNDHSIVKAYKVDPANIDQYIPITEGWLSKAEAEYGHGDDSNVTNRDAEGSKAAPIIITFDLSKDITNMEELLQHFFDLFDNSFGSNNEYLYGTEDLEVLLRIFQDTMTSIRDGTTGAYDLNGRLVDANPIDASRVKDNLMRTNYNLENLKTAYSETSAKLADVAKIISHKELMMSSGIGETYRWLSSSTYQQMRNLQDIIRPRLKDADKMQTSLEKMQTKYERITAELQRMQQALVSVGDVVYTSAYQKKVTDLFNAARYMTQTITLRITAIGLYIKELKDIQQSVDTLAMFGDQRSFFKKFFRRH